MYCVLGCIWNTFNDFRFVILLRQQKFAMIFLSFSIHSGCYMYTTYRYQTRMSSYSRNVFNFCYTERQKSRRLLWSCFPFSKLVLEHIGSLFYNGGRSVWKRIFFSPKVTGGRRGVSNSDNLLSDYLMIF